MFAFLLIVQSVVALSLVAVILMQRSEGGGLGVGGSSSGFMTARGAADFLTRATSILGGLFITLSIAMAAIAGVTREPTKIDTSLSGKTAPIQQNQPAPGQPGSGQPGSGQPAGGQPLPGRPATGPQPQPQPTPEAPAIPLAQ